MQLEELALDIDQLTEFQRQLQALQERPPLVGTLNSSEEAASNLKKQIQQKTDHILKTLAQIRSALPESEQGESEPSLSEEHERLYHAVNNLLTSPNGSFSREAELLKLVEGWRKVFGRSDDFAEPLLERANILAATCLITGGRYLKNQEFDWAIIDEAGRATVPELLVPLVRARRSIIVGDERQLPPMVDEILSREGLAGLGIERESLEESLFATLVAQSRNQSLPVVQMLTKQHRMHPAIGRLISTVFYDGKLEDAINPHDRAHKLDWIPRAVVCYSTTRLPQHQETERRPSFYNRVEVQGIDAILRRMEASYRKLGEPREVAVITPYNAQIAELREQINPENSSWKALKIEIATVDAFQGRDRDIVLYSTVRSNNERKLGFLKDWRRLNVALSRARQLLIIVGDIWMLENGRAGPSGTPFQELVRYMRDHQEDCQIQDLQMGVSHG